VAFDNRAAGFYQNHHLASDFFYNNTSFNNKAGNFNLLGYVNGGDSSLGILRNNIAFMGTALLSATIGNHVDAANNSWNLTTGPVAGDFQSTDTLGVSGPRQADGSLPNLNFMKLKQSSALIDKGVNVGFAYAGSAPDLGAYEYGTVTAIAAPLKRFSAPSNGKEIRILDLQGRTLALRSKLRGLFFRR
jgi:hypothetical protein